MKNLKSTTIIPERYLRDAMPRSYQNALGHMVADSALRRAIGGLTSAIKGMKREADLAAMGFQEIGRTMRRLNSRVMARRRKKLGRMRISSKPRRRQSDPRRIKGPMRMGPKGRAS